ncbi:hypothetical protein VIGAN_08156600 [Vigna angularis var. angularis]|uniref:Uncharacterized protein n=1 Tax=Vigna angularis var. angularis TaxID=157739 RepID=A0A0S3SPW3_PHAAN|nr:hypothetical protein VIGAN_08156600 [Vigna angularis var. angularis]
MSSSSFSLSLFSLSFKLAKNSTFFLLTSTSHPQTPFDHIAFAIAHNGHALSHHDLGTMQPSRTTFSNNSKS